MSAAHEVCIAQLEASGEYRVLRRLQPRGSAPSPLPGGARTGLIIDVETTGMDAAHDEVIELAMVRFAFTPEGDVLGVDAEHHGLNQPSKPIPEEITQITGIDDAAVQGHRFDLEAVGDFVAPAHIVIAHNAAFDRLFAERLHPHFQTKAWGCSMAEPPWREEGYEGLKLSYLASESGFFYTRHRAIHDCMATLELLARPMPRSGRTALCCLLERARAPSWKLWAEQAPFERKDDLKRRGYRWSGGEDGRPKAWWIEVAEDALSTELAHLEQVYGRPHDPLRRRVNAFDRYSTRA